MPTETAEIGAATERAELQQLVRAAIDGLNPGERDVIELSLVHDLDGDELAEALGVSRNHAHALLSRARSQLERSLGALVVARTGREACADLDAMLAGWDGQLTVLMRKRISRHIEQCEVCGERKRRELTPALFAGVAPVVALFPAFRAQLLRMLADRSPAGLAHRLTVANRAGPFGPNGFPKPISPSGAAPWHHVLHHPHAMMAGAATSVVAAGAIVVGIIGGPHHGQPAAGPAGGPTPRQHQEPGPRPGRPLRQQRITAAAAATAGRGWRRRRRRAAVRPPPLPCGRRGRRVRPPPRTRRPRRAPRPRRRRGPARCRSRPASSTWCRSAAPRPGASRSPPTAARSAPTRSRSGPRWQAASASRPPRVRWLPARA